MSKLVHITQDGACVLDVNSSISQGFFTDGIESCVIYIIRTQSNWIAIHDSGQLSLRSLTTLIKKHGKALDITVIYGRQRIKSYIRRHKVIIKHLGFNKKANEIEINKDRFDLFVSFEGLSIKYSLVALSSYNVEFIPNREKVTSIIKLNNAFMVLGSESLIVDVQYENNEYTQKTSLIHTIDHIVDRIRKEPEFLEINLQILKEAIASEAISIDLLTNEVN